MLPSDSTVRTEFVSRNPKAKIINSELIFEQDYVAVYLVKYKNDLSHEVLTDDFALQRRNLVWSWCDDRTEQKCK